MTEGQFYRVTSRPYVKRFRYKYRRHVFDKLRAIDLVLAEFQGGVASGTVRLRQHRRTRVRSPASS